MTIDEIFYYQLMHIMCNSW